MDLIENFKIDGRPLIDLMDEIEEIDPEWYFCFQFVLLDKIRMFTVES
jgi:hypothetical protein